MLKDPALEARARASVATNCAAWSARTSRSTIRTAPLARDLRLLVRERLTQGRQRQQVLNYLVARYGEFVLLKPPFELHTLLLWGLPPVALVAGMIALVVDGAPPPDARLQVPPALSAERAAAGCDFGRAPARLSLV